MLRIASLFGLGGLVLATFLITSEGFDKIWDALVNGWIGIMGACLFHILSMAFNARAWQVITPGASRPSWLQFLGLVWVREAVNGLLPVARIGGEVVTARMMGWAGVRTAPAVASLVVDMTVSMASQFLFTFVGLGLLIHMDSDDNMVMQVSLLLLLSIPVLGALYAIQRYGLFSLLGRIWRKLAGDRWDHLVGSTERLDRAVTVSYRRHGRILSCLLWQLAGWFAGAGEIWIALYYLGHPVDYEDAVMIEALAQAVSSAVFVVPGALGVQEGGFLIFADLVDVPAEIALALSLTRRARDLILFVPALLIWQWMEARRLFRRRAEETAQAARTGSSAE